LTPIAALAIALRSSRNAISGQSAEVRTISLHRRIMVHDHRADVVLDRFAHAVLIRLRNLATDATLNGAAGPMASSALSNQTPATRTATMAKTVGDFFIDRLHQWGVRRIYGYPGDGINGVFGALQRAEGKIEFIQVRHEEMAAFMAAAHAKFTGELGVCIATSGPGAAHLVTGLYDARLDHAGAGDRRPTGADSHRRPLSTGSRPARIV
jgi:hypothetical protein